MASKLRAYLTYANVVSTVCLFVVFGGTSYAVATGSIGSPQIKNDSVRSKDVRNNGLRSTDVRDGALLAKDFKAGQLPAGEKGEQGDPGATGPAGQTGQQGPPGISGLEQVEGTSPVNSDSYKQVEAVCPAGKRVIGTGAKINGSLGGANGTSFLTDVVFHEISSHQPDGGFPGFVLVRAVEEEATAANWSVTASALCANVS